MEVLILGGTAFLSTAIAAEALSAGHIVTCLARGSSGIPPDGIALIRADRSIGLSAYEDVQQDWGAVVDVTCEPAYARDALSVLGPRAGHWTYVSSCSVYADQDRPDADEDSPTAEPLRFDDVASESTYAAAKVACEHACRAQIGDVLHICRPGLIGGPGDPSDRFGYWPARFAMPRRHPVLVPDQLEGATQTIDVRDLARWIVRSAEQRVTGTFNAVGASVALQDVLALARQEAGNGGEMVPIDTRWLSDHGVRPWSGENSLPLWIPRGSGFDGFARRSCARATVAGLVRRPLAETMAATMADEFERGVNRSRRAGLASGFEADLLGEWSRQ